MRPDLGFEEAQPAIEATATPYVCFSHTGFVMFLTFLHSYRPQTLLSGMNRFLASLEITFRRDPTNFRPRVNKLHSVKDREQKGVSIYSMRMTNCAYSILKPLGTIFS